MPGPSTGPACRPRRGKGGSGLAGRVEQGLSGGGQAYGYRPDPLNKGKMLIVEDQAEVIRRVFREYADGLSPRQIAYGSNKDRVDRRADRGGMLRPLSVQRSAEMASSQLPLCWHPHMEPGHYD